MALNIVNIATLNRIRLYSGQPGTSESTLYTVPTATNTKVTEVVACNTSPGSATVSLSAVLSGGSASNANRLLSQMNIDGNGVVILDLNVFLGTGDFLSGLQNTSGAITLTISGETYA